MTIPGPDYPRVWPSYLLDASQIDEVFDGETWRAVVRDGTADPHFARVYLEGRPEGEGAEPIIAFVAELAGQGNTEWVSMFLGNLPPVRFIP